MSLIRNPLADFLSAASLAMVVSTRLMASVTPIPPLQLIPMTGPDISYSANDVPVLVENSFTLQPYESRPVFGRVEITSNVASSVYVSARIGCTGPNGFSSKVGTVQTNHEGNDTPVGVNYPSRGHLVLYPELLLRVGADPGLYTCQLSVSNGDLPAILTAIARDYDGSSAT